MVKILHFSPLSAACAGFVLAFVLVMAPERGNAQTALPQTVTLNAGDSLKVVPQATLSTWFLLETRVAPNHSQVNEIIDPDYCSTDAFGCEVALSRQTRSRLSIFLTRELHEEALREFLHDLSTEVNQEPVNARFGVNEQGQVIVREAEKNGLALNEEESFTLLRQALLADSSPDINVRLPGEIDPPKIAGRDIARLGLKELVGEGRTNFRGSPKNRVFNIHRALKQYDGILIAPGEEFSFVDYLGEVDGAHGYLPELVIKNNKTEPEFGGGICQVSSTVFRAAVYSGLKITERRNHSYPVQYYRPYGLDATIYIPKPDLKFTNNTPGYILMQPVVEGTDLIFQFYGTKDGRKVAVDGPHILESNPDGSMKTVFTQIVTKKDGSSLIKESFWSNYKSPSLFPHPGEEIYTSKPRGWSNKQWEDYQRTRAAR